ncbi:MAG: hypothetical protein SGPRY_004044 [Prymnesium sp.]
MPLDERFIQTSLLQLLASGLTWSDLGLTPNEKCVASSVERDSSIDRSIRFCASEGADDAAGLEKSRLAARCFLTDAASQKRCELQNYFGARLVY